MNFIKSVIFWRLLRNSRLHSSDTFDFYCMHQIAAELFIDMIGLIFLNGFDQEYNLQYVYHMLNQLVLA